MQSTTTEMHLGNLDTAATSHGISTHAWGSATARFLVPLDISAQNATVHGRMTAQRTSVVTRCRITSTPHYGIRTPSHAEGIGGGQYKIAIPLRTSITVRQHDHETVLQPGELGIYDTSEAYSVGSDRPFDAAIILLPHSLIDAPRTEVARIAALALTDPRISDIRRCLLSRPDNRDAYRAPLSELTDVIRLARPRAPRNQPLHVLRARAIELISERLHDETLKPDYLAARLGVSRRLLYSAFAVDGAGVAAVIRSMRLDRARQMISVENRPSIAAIAAACGFNDPAHFSRLFSNEFGSSPSKFPHTPRPAE